MPQRSDPERRRPRRPGDARRRHSDQIHAEVARRTGWRGTSGCPSAGLLRQKRQAEPGHPESDRPSGKRGSAGEAGCQPTPKQAAVLRHSRTSTRKSMMYLVNGGAEGVLHQENLSLRTITQNRCTLFECHTIVSHLKAGQDRITAPHCWATNPQISVQPLIDVALATCLQRGQRWQAGVRPGSD